jgi:hypothetical protein
MTAEFEAREMQREAEARERAAGFAILASVAVLIVAAVSAVAWGLSQ